MNGTEKQIKWAMDKIARMEESAKEAKVKFTAHVEMIDKIIEIAKNQEHASSIISNNVDNGVLIPQNINEWKVDLKEYIARSK
jgi:hypothetical protein